uniref:Uncharacterized protein n=1 Tax=Oryza meridionalis TaxID=40149 RepID=A0A0E0EE46_9ORYZ
MWGREYCRQLVSRTGIEIGRGGAPRGITSIETVTKEITAGSDTCLIKEKEIEHKKYINDKKNVDWDQIKDSDCVNRKPDHVSQVSTKARVISTYRIIGT